MTPIAAFIAQHWPHFSAQLDSTRVRQNDVQLYLVWSIDQLKAGNKVFAEDVWNQIRDAVRTHTLENGLNPSREDLNLIADVICAMSLSCLGLLLQGGDSQMPLYQQVVASLGTHRSSVLQCKNTIEYDEHTDALQQWLREYWIEAVTLTAPDALAWQGPEPHTTRQQLDGRNIVHVHYPQGCTIIENQIINGNT